MTEREYKATSVIPLCSTIAKMRQAILYLYGDDPIAYRKARKPFVTMVQMQLSILRASLIANAREELRGDDRQDHLLNAYVEWNEDRDTITTTYVFSNRDTALMFKLARV